MLGFNARSEAAISDPTPQIPVYYTSAGTMAGSSTLAGAGLPVTAAAGTAAGVATLAGVGASTAAGVGSLVGSSTLAGVGKTIITGAGTLAGSSTLSGVGVAFSTGTTSGTMAGSSALVGVGASTVRSTGTMAGGSLLVGVTANRGTPDYTGTFPPGGPTTLTKVIPAYVYQQYADDDDIQAFFSSLNTLTQEDVDWFVNTELPVFTSPFIVGDLLDWVGTGLYGYPRPALPSGFIRRLGPLNTWPANYIALNAWKNINGENYYTTTDDVYKRCLTWNFWKGDGKYFSIRWLKRRIMRFLTGENGTAGAVDKTYQISVSISGSQVNINILNGTRTVTGGAVPNRFALNTVPPGNLKTTFNPLGSTFPLAPALKEGIDSGALALPFQFTYVVTIQS